MSTLDGAVVLITGAGGGFGQQLCRQLQERGSRLILSDRSSFLAHFVYHHQDSVVEGRATRLRLASEGGVRLHL